MGLVARAKRIVTAVLRWKPVRVFAHYTAHRGPILSQGLSWQAVFAVFAALWVTFAIAGFVIAGSPELRDGLFDFLSANIPGLIDRGDGGAIRPDDLLSAGILGWTGAIAAAVLLYTALGWLASGRDAVRAMFQLPGSPTNFFVLKLKDLGLALGFGALVIGSAALSVASTTALGSLIQWLGMDERSLLSVVSARVVGLLIVLVVDALVLGSFYRVVSGIRIPFRLLVPGTVLAAIALGVLKALGSTLLGGATNNPLLAGFAVIIGLLIWFNLICQVILIGAAWIAVTADDRGVDLNRHREVGRAPSDVTTAL
jgi:membrane protein